MTYWSILIVTLLAGAAGCARDAAPVQVAGAQPPAVGSAEALVRQGENAEKGGDSVRAEQYWSLALQAGADPKKVLPGLLRVCVAGSRLRAALNHAEPYLRNHPEANTLRYLVATLHVSLNQERAARLHLEKLLRESPAFSDAHYLLGSLDQSSEDQESALGHYRKYLELARHGEHAPEVRSRIAELQIEAELLRKGSIAHAVPASQRELPFTEMMPDEQSLFDERGPRMAAPIEVQTSAPSEQRP